MNHDQLAAMFAKMKDAGGAAILNSPAVRQQLRQAVASLRAKRLQQPAQPPPLQRQLQLRPEGLNAKSRERLEYDLKHAHERAMDNWDNEGALQLGQEFMRGVHNHRDLEAARAWLQKAADSTRQDPYEEKRRVAARFYLKHMPTVESELQRLPAITPGTPRPWAEAVTTQHAVGLKQYADDLGLSVPAAEARINAKLKDVIDRSHLWMRVPPSVLDKVLADGELKSALETGKSGAAAKDMEEYTKKRLRAETRMQGVPMDQQTGRPLYGYLAQDADGALWHNGDGPVSVARKAMDRKPIQDDPLAQYGRAAIRLKPHMRERATWTAEDSLDYTGSGQAPTMAPSPVTAPSHRSINIGAPIEDSPDALKYQAAPLHNAEKTERPEDHAGYWEAQYHGGIKLSDIAEIVFAAPPKAALKQALAAKNVSFRVARRPETT